MSEREQRALQREVKRLQYELSAASAQLPFLRHMVEGSRDGLALVDEQGCLLECNRTLSRLLGVPRERLPGSRISSWPWHDDDPLRTDQEQVLLAQGATGEPRLAKLASGEMVEIVIAGAPTDADRTFVLSIRQMTDLGAAARALRDAQAEVQTLSDELSVQRKFGALFEHSPDALVLVDEHGVVQLRNPLAAHYWPSLVVGSPITALADELDQALAARLQSSSFGPDSLLCRLSAEAGPALELQVRLASVTLSLGQGVLIAASDVTVQRAAAKERESALARVSRALEERGVLLQEVHHRVKNNLQIISSLLSMQADQTQSPAAKSALDDSVSRVHSMALVHQLLYGTHDFTHIDLASYLDALVAQLRSAMDPLAVVEVNAPGERINIDQAIPCGLALNELLTNALKHGRSEDGTCSVSVDLLRIGSQISITVRDHGPGLPPDYEARRRTSLGMIVVASLMRQLGGEVSTSSMAGACFTLRFPL